MKQVFSETAKYYDKLYQWKDYGKEIDKLIKLIRLDLTDKSHTLLDVACGTGEHIKYLKKFFQSEGLDICKTLLDIAGEKNPEINFYLGDMLDFDLGKNFDIITCLFSSIGYMKTSDLMKSAIKNMVKHLNPNGFLVIEPWLTPEVWKANTTHAFFIDEPELKIARINTSFTRNKISVFDLHYLIGTPEKTEHFVEHHELGLFTEEEMTAILEEFNLNVTFDEEGISGRGMYIAQLSA